MKYLGVDAHKRYVVICVVDEYGKVRGFKKLYSREDIVNFVRSIKDDCKAVVEAGRCWGTIYDLLERIENVKEVVLANPLHVKLIAQSQKKTDKIDAHTLAQLLRVNLIPNVYVPPQETRLLKYLLRHRCFLVWQRTTIKNRIHVIIDRNHVSPPPVTNLFGKYGMEFLKNVKLPDSERYLLDRHLELLNILNKEIEKTERKIYKFLLKNKTTKLLMSVPGIGKFFAALIQLEIHDIRRFPSPRNLFSYAGLVPSTYASGGKIYHGRLIKCCNKWLRWAFIEAAHSAIRSSPYFKNYYSIMRAKKGSSTAIIATARKLAKAVYYVLKDERPYEEIYSPDRLQI